MRKVLGIGFVACATVGLAAYQHVRACDQNCALWDLFCSTDGNGNCKAGECYRYSATGSTFTFTCWECGGPGGGWCTLGDPNLRCVNTGQSIDYRYYQSCTRSCNKANTYVKAGGAEEPTSKTGSFNRWVCNAK